jgi:hypothetical protein
MRIGVHIGLAGGSGAGFEPDAIVALDFASGRYRVGAGGASTPDLASLPGLTVSRASPAISYAETAAGGLAPFAANVARITDRGLLAEEGRTNLITNSQAFGAWTLSGGAAISSDAVAAPDATLTADTWNGSGGLESNQATVAASSAYASSIYFKAGTATSFDVTLQNRPAFAQTVTVRVNAATGATSNLAGNSASVAVDTLANGWFRLRPTGSTPGGATGHVMILNTCDGTLHLWGAQMEAGAFATSYIPTTSVAVTRSADDIGLAGNWAAPTSVYAEWDQTDAFSTYRGVFGLAVAASPTANSAEVYQANSAAAFVEVSSGGGTQSSMSKPVIAGRNRLAARFATNDVNLAINGSAATADTVATVPTCDRLAIGANRNLALKLNSYLRCLVVYPWAISDADLQTRTA